MGHTKDKSRFPSEPPVPCARDVRLLMVVSVACLLLSAACNTVTKNTPICATLPPASCESACKPEQKAWWSCFRDPELDRLMTRLKLCNYEFRSIAADWQADHNQRLKYAVGGEMAKIELAEEMDKLRLQLQSGLAQQYFALRFIDEERRILREALQAAESNLRLATERYQTGLSSEFDVEGAKAEVATTKADLARMKKPRDQLENGIGLLVGCDPGAFRIEPRSSIDCDLPVLCKAVPFSILGNRPDVAVSIVLLRQANDRVGIERDCYFPAGNLISGPDACHIQSAGFTRWSCETFALHPQCNVRPKLRAAQWKALVDYQKSMMQAFQEVEDALAEISALCAEKEAHLSALEAARQTARLIRQQYDEGVVSSTEVTESRRRNLAADRRLVQICGQQYSATVKLLEALGGNCAGGYFK